MATTEITDQITTQTETGTSEPQGTGKHWGRWAALAAGVTFAALAAVGVAVVADDGSDPAPAVRPATAGESVAEVDDPLVSRFGSDAGQAAVEDDPLFTRFGSDDRDD